ncbi:putative bifunctional diguanylate cyclase/phosphodiesterase [Psychrobacillus lasiicapitis]|nr:GGDEF domain-containing phosphodiesterase [Psychrobacillus lasiicapitis]
MKQLSAENFSSLPNQVIDQILNATKEGIMITDDKMTISLVNTAFESLTGYTLQEVKGKTPRILQSGKQDASFYQNMWKDIRVKGSWQGEIWNKRKNGEIYPERLTIHTIVNEEGIVISYFGVFSDISHNKVIEKEIEELTFTDTLTNTMNRHTFYEQLEDLIATSTENSEHAMLVVDLDRFKQINETLGNEVGDFLLTEVADRINSIVRANDLVSRYGGDEFLVTITDLNFQKDAVHFAEKLNKQLNKPFYIQDREIYITSSIGISFYPQDGIEVETLIQKADKAMYFAKQNGRNQYAFYFDELQTDAERLLLLESELRKAIQQKAFVIHYQPKVSLDTNQIIGVEALVRWANGTLGVVSPAEFIPFAEDTGLIIPISEVILEKVCMDIVDWRSRGIQHIPVSINIAALHFQQDDFMERINAILTKYNCSPQLLELELTERTVMEDSESIVHKLVKLKRMGFKLSIDDFGTGYSSLSYLNRFPLNYLKIDSSFIQQMTELQDKQAIVDTIILMAHRLHIKVIAEGAETKDQVKLLKEMGCDIVQGYYFSKPISSAAFLDFLELWEIHKQERTI